MARVTTLARPLLALAVLGLISTTPASALQTSGPSCAVTQGPAYLPLPRCKPSNKTLEDAKAVAWKFAPVVYSHPMERYHLQSPDVWYAASELYQQDLRPQNASIFAWFNQSWVDELMFMPRSFRTVLNATQLSEEQREDIIGGAPYVGNRSTAKVYYTVDQVYEDAQRTVPVPGLWLYSYNLYYSWNGCSNQDISISLDGELQVVQYLLCPVGVHEGDWERISMLVCAEDLELQQTAYSQHGWWETRDCTVPGQCPREPNENDPSVLNPVTYIGFESHANYYEESPLMVYAWKNASFKGAQLDNLGGVWVGDRTLSDPSKKFVPTPDNIVYLPGNTTEVAGKPGWDWATYPGNWGAPLQAGKSSFLCLNQNQTYPVACPDNQATRALRTAFKLLDLVGVAVGGVSSDAGTPGLDDESFKSKSASNSSWMSAATITGPLFRLWTYQWLPERHAPIYDDFKQSTDVIICPEDATVTLPYLDFAGALNPSTSVNTIVSYLVGMCAGAIIMSFIFILLMMVPSLLSKAVGAPAVLLAAGTAVVGSGRSVLQKSKQRLPGAAARSGSSPAATALDAEGSQALAPGLEPACPVAAAAAAVEKSSHHHPASLSAPPEAALGLAASAPSKQELEAVLSTAQDDGAIGGGGGGSSKHHNLYLYLFWAIACYVVAVVLLVLGTQQLVSNSVSALATQVINNSAPIEAIEWLIIGSLIVAGVCDVFAWFVVLIANTEHFSFGKWRVRNRLHSRWVRRHTYKIHIITAGLVILVLSIACILFGLGLVVMTVQLAARVACSSLANFSYDDITVSDVCISVQSLSDQPICGWQALQICYEVTNMRVLMISMGALFLLWSHVAWLVLLLLSMWRYKEWKVVVRQPKDDGLEGSLRAPSTSSEAGAEERKSAEGEDSILDASAAEQGVVGQ